MSKGVLAFDFGASSGRAILSRYENGRIELEEIHRFSNDPVSLGGTLYWDILRLMHDVKIGINLAHHAGGFDSIGIDTWGVDFGLLDKDGRLLENPVHYRDSRNVGMMEEVYKLIPIDELYKITGIQSMDHNTICQLYYLVTQRPDLIERAHTLLFMPDLIRYFLTDEKTTEYTIASTSQLMDCRTRSWAWDIIDRLGIPHRLFTDIIMPGSPGGVLREDICSELGVPSAKVIAVSEHDTASAVVAVPTQSEDFIYISCGTWSLFGTELKEPLVDKKAMEYSITNEGGYDGQIRFLKNISGLWMIQEARREWARKGTKYSYAELERLALAEEPFKCFIDTDHPSFNPQGDHPARVQEFCRQTGQYVPQTVGEIMRCIYESLALKYRHTLEQISDVTGKSYDKIHVVGGGTKDNLLCQMTANVTNHPVDAGPIEATVFGNVIAQMIARGDISSKLEGRELISKSQEITTYYPTDMTEWESAYQQFKLVIPD